MKNLSVEEKTEFFSVALKLEIKPMGGNYDVGDLNVNHCTVWIFRCFASAGVFLGEREKIASPQGSSVFNEWLSLTVRSHFIVKRVDSGV